MPLFRDCKNNQLSLLNLKYQTMLRVNSMRPYLLVFKVFKLLASCISARMFYDFGKKSVNFFYLLLVARFSMVLQIYFDLLRDNQVVDNNPNIDLMSSKETRVDRPSLISCKPCLTASILHGSSKYGSLLGLELTRISVLGVSSMMLQNAP